MLRESCGHFEQVRAEAEGAEAFALRCGKKTYVYIYNPSKKPARTIRISVPKLKNAIEAFSFESMTFRKLATETAEGGLLTIGCNIPYQGEALYAIQSK